MKIKKNFNQKSFIKIKKMIIRNLSKNEKVNLKHKIIKKSKNK